MEEEILKMIKTHFYNVDGTPEKSTKEITQHFSSFVEWCIINTFFEAFEQRYGILDTDLYFDSIEGLYTFWKTNCQE